MSYDTKIANEGVRSWDKQTNKQTNNILNSSKRREGHKLFVKFDRDPYQSLQFFQMKFLFVFFQ